MCYCVALQRIETTTRVVILQHPRERDVPIGTARMASLCLPAAELHVGVDWTEHAGLAAALADPDRPPILLYPGSGARDILSEPPRGPVTLVVVDGTWSQARTVVRDNPVLQALPRYAFATPEPSQYRIRREPRAEYVSTIEALMHVLGALEGDPPRFRSLLEPLRAMVDAQLACQAQSPRRTMRQPRRARPRPPMRAQVLDVLAQRFDDVVCVVGEPNAWPYRTGDARPPEELVHWVAHRVATGETFDMIAAPEEPLSPSTAFHSELPEDAIRAGAARAELFARFAQFAKATDLLCAWGHHGIDLAAQGGAALPADRLDLRAQASRLTRRRFGSLEDYAATIASAPSPLAAGRAGRRLAMLVQIIRAWRELASSPV